MFGFYFYIYKFQVIDISWFMVLNATLNNISVISHELQMTTSYWYSTYLLYLLISCQNFKIIVHSITFRHQRINMQLTPIMSTMIMPNVGSQNFPH